jgi:hypothetical protein
MYSGFEIDRQPGDPAPFCVWLMFYVPEEKPM